MGDVNIDPNTGDLIVSRAIRVPMAAVTIKQIRAQGAGGQNVNKVSSAVHLHFDPAKAGLPEAVLQRLMRLRDHRVLESGEVVIKSQVHRTFQRNKVDALGRLADLLGKASKTPKKRIPTKPGKAAVGRRLDEKRKRSRLKQTRSRVTDSD